MSRVEPQVDRLPPHSVESEQGMLGCFLHDSGLLVRFQSEFPAGKMVFYELRHQDVFDGLMAMDWVGIGPDLAVGALCQLLKEHGKLEGVGGMAYVAALPDAAATAYNYEYHAGVLREKFLRRQVIAESHQLMESAWDESADEKLLLNRMTEFAKKRGGGGEGRLHTMGEIEERYSKRCQSIDSEGFSMGKWLPGFGRLRTLIPGNLIIVVAGTGVGKTAILSNFALAAEPLPTLFMQLELPEEDIFERMAALKSKMPCVKVESAYKTGRTEGREFYDTRFPGLVICDEARLSVVDIEARIMRYEIKMGRAPKVVLLDYLGLVQGRGQNRYDRFSNIAEDLKGMAKVTGTIVVAACQRSRQADGEGPEVGLYDAKESGSIENSATFMLGAWRYPDKPAVIHIVANKCNKGGAGTKVVCNYNVDTLAITEMSKYEDD